MKPCITITKTITSSNEGPELEDCTATYYDPQRNVVEHGEGDATGQALENPYRRLEQLGYSRSDLPKPARGETYRTL